MSNSTIDQWEQVRAVVRQYDNQTLEMLVDAVRMEMRWRDWVAEGAGLAPKPADLHKALWPARANPWPPTKTEPMDPEVTDPTVRLGPVRG